MAHLQQRTLAHEQKNKIDNLIQKAKKRHTIFGASSPIERDDLEEVRDKVSSSAAGRPDFEEKTWE